MAITPHELDGVSTDRMYIGGMNIRQLRFRNDGKSIIGDVGPSFASSAGTGPSQELQREDTLMAIGPRDFDLGFTRP